MAEKNIGLRKKIQDGLVLQGTMISEFAHPNLLRIFKSVGFDYVIIDGEHGPFDATQLSLMIAMGNMIELPVLVRIPSVDRGKITSTLDMGADGFLVPMINTAEQAQEVVSYAKYMPEGKRGISLTRAHTGYHPPALKEYMQNANRRITLLVQIETREALANIEKISEITGIDGLIVGPSDLSSDLGVPGEWDAPVLLNAAKTVAETAMYHNIHSGTVSGNLDFLNRCREYGMNLFCVGSELSMLVKGARQSIESFQNRIK